MKNKLYIRAAAFITSLLILLVLMFSGFTVFAVDNISPVDKYDITEVFDTSMFSDFSNASNIFLNSSDGSYLTYNSILGSKPSFADNQYYTGVNASLFNYYCWTNDRLYLCDSDSFVAVAKTGNSPTVMCYTHVPDDVYNYMLNHNGDIGYSYINSTFNFYSLNSNISASSLKTIDDKKYFIVGYGDQKLLNTNLPVYPVDSVYNVSSVQGLDQINPNYTNPNSESSSNNLYLEDAYFLWTTYDPVFDTLVGDSFDTDNIYNSFVTFNYQLTPYQKEHLNEFTINVKATISYNMKFTLKSDYKKWSGSYLYQAPLSQFNTGSLKYTFQDIFNSTGFTSYFNANSGGEIDFDNSSFTLTMDAELVDNKGGTSSDYIDIFDFLNNKVRNLSKAITNNNNPYVPSNLDEPIQNNAQVPTVQTGDGVVPTGNSNSVVPSGNGAINVVQNNNTGLINPKPVTDMVKNELLPNENDTNFVGMLAEQTHEDAFVQLLSSTFSFVPVNVWNSLSHYFDIFLTMLVAFFGLRLILDIL